MSTGKTLRFTKMHGAGNDFVVLNNLDCTLDLTPDLIKRLGDRHFGVGADQILIVEPARSASNDFRYRIFNADGHEVQQCGNGARCFAQYIADKGLSDKKRIKVETIPGVIEPELIAHNWIKVNMGPASFQPTALPFNPEGLSTRKQGQVTQYCLPVSSSLGQEVWVAVASMGNPHVVVLLDELPSDDLVNTLGPILESHPRFPQRVNVGFLHITNSENAKLRVYERGAGETLACGTGACAAAVLGIRMGHLHSKVNIHKVGGILTIEWNGAIGTDVFMTGPAQTVFEGEFYL